LSGLLKDIAKAGGFGLAGMAATHKLGGLARSGMFGIGGAVLAHHDQTPHPVFPTIAAMPDAQGFGDPVSYLSAVQQWAQGQLGAIQQGQGQGQAPPMPGGQ
jgi:hypothetical protein